MDGPPLVRKITLHAVLPVHHLLAQLDAGLIANPSDREELRKQWEKASASYRSQSGQPTRSFLDPDDITALVGVDQTRKETLLKRLRTYPHLDTHPIDIYSVRLSKLVTPQVTVNVARAEHRADIKPGMTQAELFEVAFEARGQPEVVGKQIVSMGPNIGTLLFTSHDEDLRLHFPPVQYRKIRTNERDDESLELESLCLPLGGGLPFAHAYRVECAPGVSRLILMNGIHRAFRLAQLGYDRWPLLVTDRNALELPPQIVEMPTNLLLNPGSNPPVITDFLNNDFAISLDFYAALRTVRIALHWEQSSTVLR